MEAVQSFSVWSNIDVIMFLYDGHDGSYIREQRLWGGTVRQSMYYRQELALKISNFL